MIDSEDTRTKVLNAAGPVFAELGFQQATVREICRRAGVNLASVNYYFGDKDNLYLETVKLAYRSRLEDFPLPTWPEGTDPATKLRSFIATTVSRMVGLEQAPWPTRLLMREVLKPTAACREVVEEYFQPHMEQLQAILVEVLPSDTPKHERLRVGMSIIGQCVFYRVSSEVVSMMVPQEELDAEYSIAKLTDHIADFSLAALGLIEPVGQLWRGSDESKKSIVSTR